MTVRRFDSAPVSKATRTPEGWLRAPARLTRVGVFEYRRADGGVRRELRLPEEVFRADSLASFELVPLTDNHPRDGLDAKNTGAYAIGAVGKVQRDAEDAEYVSAEILVTDAAAVERIENGKREVSNGYFCDTDETPGVWVDSQGRAHKYDAIQRNIRANHVAIVDKARAGPGARVRLDAADAELVGPASGSEGSEAPDGLVEGRTDMKKITIDGVEVEVSDLAMTMLARERKVHADMAETLKTESRTARADADKANARADAEKARAERAAQALAEATDPKRLDAQVSARVDLLSRARGVLGAAYKADGKTDREVKVAVLAKLTPEAKLDSRSDEYVTARFDLAIEAEEARNPATERAAAAVRGDDSGKGASAPTPTTRADDHEAAYEAAVFGASPGR